MMHWQTHLFCFFSGGTMAAQAISAASLASFRLDTLHEEKRDTHVQIAILKHLTPTNFTICASLINTDEICIIVVWTLQELTCIRVGAPLPMFRVSHFISRPAVYVVKKVILNSKTEHPAARYAVRFPLCRILAKINGTHQSNKCNSFHSA